MTIVERRKYFTVEQANRTLPLVRRIVEDIYQEHRMWQRLISRYEVIAADSRADQGESPQQVVLRTKIQESAARIDACMRELGQVGCVFKGFELGLVDFYGRCGDRDVLWCWKRGETEISHWHELDVGFVGRQCLPLEVRG